MRDLPALRQFLRSVVASVTAFALDFLVCLGLVSGLGMGYLPATAVSFTLGTILNYFLCSRWAFLRRPKMAGFAQFGIFLGLSALGLALNGLAMYLFAGLLGLHYLVARVVSSNLVFFFNYFGRKLLVFALPGKKDLPLEPSHGITSL